MYIPLAATVATVFIGSANARTFQYDGYTVNPSDNVNITGLWSQTMLTKAA
jgi:hypothetical protein